MGLDQSILIYTFPRQSPFLGFQCNENTRVHFKPKFFIFEELLQWKIEDHLEGER